MTSKAGREQSRITSLQDQAVSELEGVAAQRRAQDEAFARQKQGTKARITICMHLKESQRSMTCCSKSSRRWHRCAGKWTSSRNSMCGNALF